MKKLMYAMALLIGLGIMLALNRNTLITPLTNVDAETLQQLSQ